jgi:hypothetical protein
MVTQPYVMKAQHSIAPKDELDSARIRDTRCCSDSRHWGDGCTSGKRPLPRQHSPHMAQMHENNWGGHDTRTAERHQSADIRHAAAQRHFLA